MFRPNESREHKLFYQKSIIQYGVDDIRALHWNSVYTQEIRFEQLLQLGNFEKKSILDLGCGVGDFRKFLTKKKIHPLSYTGIDFLEDFVLLARQRYPRDRWLCGDFLSFSEEKFDIILCNGALNVKKDDNMKFLKSFFSHFLPMSKEALGITLLKYAPGYMEDSMIYTYNPGDVRRLIRTLQVPFDIREGYIDNDFACFLYPGPL